MEISTYFIEQLTPSDSFLQMQEKIDNDIHFFKSEMRLLRNMLICYFFNISYFSLGYYIVVGIIPKINGLGI